MHPGCTNVLQDTLSRDLWPNGILLRRSLDPTRVVAGICLARPPLQSPTSASATAALNSSPGAHGDVPSKHLITHAAETGMPSISRGKIDK